MKIFRQLFPFIVGITAVVGNAQRNELTPTDSLPQRWEYYPSAEGQIISLDDNWWTNFDDPLLNSLVAKGLEANYDLRTALNNISIALNTYKSARSAYYPTLSASAGWEKERVSGKIGTGAATNRSYWNGQLGISWQVDLFGKLSQQAKSKKSLWQASQAEWAATMLTVVQQIIDNYIDLRSAQAQLILMQQHAERQLQIVEMVLARKEAGVASKLDVAQAKTVYYSTLANIPGYENTIASCINALAVLLGTYPSDLPKELYNAEAPLPRYEQMISTGIPVDLLRRRPDIIEMEKTVASYAAELGVAKKDFLPTLTLEGTISTSATNLKDVFSRQSIGYTVAPTLTWNFSTGGEQIYNVRAAKENLQSEINNYNLTVLTAIEETNNALTSYYTDMKHIRMVDDVVIWAQTSLDLSLSLYKDGLSPFSNVVDAQETLLEYETQAVTAKAAALTSLVDIYVALGGGWDANYIK